MSPLGIYMGDYFVTRGTESNVKPVSNLVNDNHEILPVFLLLPEQKHQYYHGPLINGDPTALRVVSFGDKEV